VHLEPMAVHRQAMIRQACPCAGIVPPIISCSLAMLRMPLS
jgi:hypothetical protein